jgi:hypothetical protein
MFPDRLTLSADNPGKSAECGHQPYGEADGRTDMLRHGGSADPHGSRPQKAQGQQKKKSTHWNSSSSLRRDVCLRFLENEIVGTWGNILFFCNLRIGTLVLIVRVIALASLFLGPAYMRPKIS